MTDKWAEALEYAAGELDFASEDAESYDARGVAKRLICAARLRSLHAALRDLTSDEWWEQWRGPLDWGAAIVRKRLQEAE